MRCNALFLASFILWAAACGSSQQSTVSPPTPDKSYQFVGDSCDTGSHIFSGTDKHEVLLEYCRTLLNDLLNNSCASEERDLKFQEDCSAVSSELVSEKPEEKPATPIENDKAPKTFYGILSPDDELDYQDIPQSTHEFQVSVTYLDIIKLDDYTFRAEENLQGSAGNIFVALRECGFFLAGPHCREGQVSEKLWDQLVRINEKTFYYIASEYSDYPFPMAYFFELDAKNNYTPTGSLYLYSIHDKNRAHSPAQIILEQTGTAIGKAQFLSMSLESKWQTLQISEVSQEILASSNWLIDQKDFVTESFFQEISPKILKSLRSKKNFISDARSGRSIFHYLRTLQRLMPEDQFKNYLHELTFGMAKDLFTLQSAIMLISEGETLEENIDLATLALQTKDKDTFLRALDALTKIEGFSLEDSELNILINSLTHKDFEIAKQAYNALLVFGINKTHLPALEERIKGKVPSYGAEFILSLLASIKDISALEKLISYMSHTEENVRLVAYAIIENMTFTNEVLPFLKKQLTSTFPETRIAAARALAKMNTFEAMKMIIENVSDPLALNRTTLLQIVGSYTYSDIYITVLQNQFKSPYLDVRMKMFELILQIGTKAAYQAVIKNLSDPDPVFRGMMIAVIEKMTFTADFIPVLVTGFYSSYVDVKQAVTRILIAIPGREATVAIIRNLSQSDPGVRASLIAELTKRNIDDSFLLDLKTLFYSYYDEVKQWAFDTIIAMNTEKSILLLIDSMSNSTESIRIKIINYLNSIAMKESYLSNLKWSFSSAYYVDVRKAIALLIDKVPSTQATIILINIMDAYESLVRETVLSLLENRTMSADCIPALKSQITDYYADVRMMAIKLLAKIPSQEALTALKNQLKIERDNTVKIVLNKAIADLEVLLGIKTFNVVTTL